MYQEEFQAIKEQIPEIKVDRNYWLVRTNNGEYYDEFKKNSIIGIGWNRLKVDEIVNVCVGTEDAKKALTSYIKEGDKEDGIPGYVASQILRFMCEIKKDDIVIIPSEHSTLLAIGEVLDDITYEKAQLPSGDIIQLDINKFRKVKWLKTTFKTSIEPELYKILFSHHPVSFVSDYSTFIDRLLNEIYEKDNIFHLKVNIDSSQKISGRTLFRTWLDIFDLVDEFSHENGIKTETDDVETKVRVQSPGIIEFIASNPETIILIGTILIMVVGGGIEFRHPKFPLSIKTDGLIQKVIDFLNARNRRKVLNRIISKSEKELEINKPEQLVKIIETISNNENNKKD